MLDQFESFLAGWRKRPLNQASVSFGSVYRNVSCYLGRKPRCVSSSSLGWPQSSQEGAWPSLEPPLLKLVVSVLISVLKGVLLVLRFLCLVLDVGYLSMSDEWFGEYVLEIAVDKKFIPAEMLEVLSQEPTVLPAWDPMGALAGHCTCQQ